MARVIAFAARHIRYALCCGYLESATLKAMFPIAYAAAFAAALAQKHACPLVTGDPGFRTVDWLEVDWIAAPVRR